MIAAQSQPAVHGGTLQKAPPAALVSGRQMDSPAPQTQPAAVSTAAPGTVSLPGDGQQPSLRRDVGGPWRDADPWPMGRLGRAALRGVVAALCPSPESGASDTPPLADVAAPVADAVRRTMRYMEWPLAIGLHLALLLLDWSPVWRLRDLRPLHRLHPRKAAAIVDAVGASRFSLQRHLVMGARAAVLMQWYDLPEVHKRMNYDPVGHMRARIALRERLLAGGTATAEDLLHPLLDELPAEGDPTTRGAP